MSTLAQGVAYATEINEASRLHGVDAALVQSIISVTGGDTANVTGLPDEAHAYAKAHSNVSGSGRGIADPESNILACAWWLRVMLEVHGDQWVALTWYFGGGPRGEALMRRVYYTEMPKWVREFD